MLGKFLGVVPSSHTAHLIFVSIEWGLKPKVCKKPRRVETSSDCHSKTFVCLALMKVSPKSVLSS